MRTPRQRDEGEAREEGGGHAKAIHKQEEASCTCQSWGRGRGIKPKSLRLPFFSGPTNLEIIPQLTAKVQYVVAWTGLGLKCQSYLINEL